MKNISFRRHPFHKIMNQLSSKKSNNRRFVFEFGFLLLAFASIFALIITFGVAISGFSFISKIISFALIVISYLFIYKILYTIQKNSVVDIKKLFKEEDSNSIFDSDIDEKLLVLEEAGKFFGASLKSIDMFRLVASRVGEIIPFSTCAFFLIDKNNKFVVPFAIGKNSRLFESLNIECRDGIAGKAFLSRQIEVDKKLVTDRQKIDKDILADLNSSIAIPLFRGGEVFCLLVLYSESENSFEKDAEILAEAVGERITPLIIGSLSYELSLSNALTDTLTNLPNERAFYLVLENQVAEAQRFQEQRSLTILAIDIKNFDELNQKYGHSTGDCILGYSAEMIKKQLRQMDLLCRTINDEFLVILPTAGEKITEHIIKRIENAFRHKPFTFSNDENCFVDLSFGSATFQADGETAAQLIKIAKLRKHQSKDNGENSVIFFPRQYLN